MTVQIQNPGDGSIVDIVQGIPFEVTGGCDTADDVEGVLTDNRTGETFPSTGPGKYGAWTLDFDTDGSILGGDYLSVYAYDTGTGDGDQATYQQQAYNQQQTNKAPSASTARKAALPPPACVTVAASGPIPTSGVKKITVTITLPAKTKGFVFLSLLKMTGDPETSPAFVQAHLLPPSTTKTTRDVTFR